MIEHMPLKEVLSGWKPVNSDTWEEEFRWVVKHERDHFSVILSQVDHAGEVLEPVMLSDDGVAVNGHYRILAARHLRLETIPVRRVASIYK